MSENSIITELTPGQEALIPVYREKWRKIALSTEIESSGSNQSWL